MLVSWTASSSTVNITGYTVYLVPQLGGQATTVVVEASETNTTVPGLMDGGTYSITIRTNSNTLPSTVTGPENITLGKDTTIVRDCSLIYITVCDFISLQSL